ncbi:MAG: hypothetical protein GX259_05895 [Bacteroidales bacterium]|nr:hypothetical protein [Bacteroidales bacterium]
MRMLLILTIILICEFSLAQNKLFPKSKNKLKISEYFVEGNSSKYKIPLEVEFIIIQKKPKGLHNEKLFLLSFGCENHPCFEFVKLNNDTLFYSLNKDGEHQQFFPLFILNTKAIGDTIFVRKFGVIENQKIVLEQQLFSKKLNGTVFCYKLIEEQSATNNFQGKKYYHNSNDEDKVHVTEIAINIDYGFVWVKYILFGINYKVQFY